MVNNSPNITQKVWNILHAVVDPEIPVLSITDLGIVRAVILKNNTFIIQITPTYSGCPAVDAIAVNIKLALLGEGISNFKIEQLLAPAWTTDWITENGKNKLLAYGIAPPVGKAINGSMNYEIEVACPQCRSVNTQLISAFGSTACKALYKCNNCLEPFDYFKCH
jgi:ring-1,2-phenylacetyl-CoA epoxidase subunit PaaD